MNDTTDKAPQQAAQETGWDGAEEWEKLAWHLCAEENGEDACGELIWESGPTPEPWGDRWLKYEGEARRMIALVRTHVPAPQQAAPAVPVKAIEALVLQAMDMAVANGANSVSMPDEIVQVAYWLAGREAALSKAAPKQEVREHGETLADFQEGQWWINELDAMASHPIDQTIRVTPDLRRAVAVVHNLLRVVAQRAAPQQVAPAVLHDIEELADEYADTAAKAHVESLYGTSKYYAAECLRDSNEARSRLMRALCAALQQAAPAEPLIRQMLEALEEICPYYPGDDKTKAAAITAARAWLNENGGQP